MSATRRIRRNRTRNASPTLASLAAQVFKIVARDQPPEASCVQWALAALLAGTALGRHMAINAGSAQWQAGADLACGYVYDPSDAHAEVTVLSLDASGGIVEEHRPGEFHAWAVDISARAVVDPTSRYQRDRFVAMGYDWTEPPLPDCIDLDGQECIRRGWLYQAHPEVTKWASKQAHELAVAHDDEVRAWFRANRRAA